MTKRERLAREAKTEAKAKTDLDNRREELIALLPDAILAIANCIRQPARNAQTQLAAAKVVLDRTLPALATTQISSQTSDGQSVTLNVNFLPPKKDDES